MYLDNAIDPEVLNNIKNNINSIKAKQVLGPGMLNQLIEKFPYSIFPQAKTSEKPTKVVSDLLQGKAAILVSGAPYALVIPAVFIEFFQDIEDYANRTLVANFDRLLRLLASIIVLTLSSIYLVFLSYNSELTPLNLIKVIVGSRSNIPIPPFIENTYDGNIGRNFKRRWFKTSNASRINIKHSWRYCVRASGYSGWYCQSYYFSGCCYYSYIHFCNS